jgi:amidase
MARTVADAATLLGAMAGVDPQDPATAAAGGHIEADYRKFLVRGDLKGVRIGVARTRVTGYSPHTDRLYGQAIAHLKKLGAEIVDPVDFGSLGDWDEDELQVLLYELKANLDEYLGKRPGIAVKSLAEVIAFNEKYVFREMRYFGQDLFEKAQAKGTLAEAEYIDAAKKSRRLAREGIDGPMAQHRLDAIIAPTGSPAWLTDPVNGDHLMGSSSSPAAVAGYPSITVTMGSVQRLPIGLSFVGTAWSEGKLIRIAYAYEQLTRHRVAPALPQR